MSTPLDQVINEIQLQHPPETIKTALDGIIAEMRRHCYGMTLEEIEVWMKEKESRERANLLKQIVEMI